MSCKILVFGQWDESSKSGLEAVFAKAKALQTKHQFSCLLLLGDTLARHRVTDELAHKLCAGQVDVPLMTYCMAGRVAVHPELAKTAAENHDMVCRNLMYCGRQAYIKTDEGIALAVLGGTRGPAGPGPEPGAESGAESAAEHYTDAEHDWFVHEREDADIFVSTEWPVGMPAPSGQGPPLPESTDIVAVAQNLRPKYWFVSSPGGFQECAPYYCVAKPRDMDAHARATRLIALASFDNSDSQKWFYAFTIQPGFRNVTRDSGPIRANPFVDVAPSGGRGTTQHGKQDKRDIGGRDGGSDEAPQRSKRRRGNRLDRVRPDSCFFCLANPRLEQHLLASIAEDTYIALPKGPLTTPDVWAGGAEFPGHVLIVPMAHSATLLAMPEGARAAVVREVEAYRNGLAQLYAAHGCDMVMYEVSRTSLVHLHWQCLPVPTAMTDKVVPAFAAAAAESSVELQARDREPAEAEYFRLVVLRDGAAIAETYTAPLAGVGRFDLQFGRRTMARVLGLEARIDWRSVAQTQEEEERDTGRFKRAFAPYDFSMREAAPEGVQEK